MAQGTATQQQQQSVVPASEVFWSLVHKADKKFSKITHIPFYHRNRQDYDAYFYKVFKVYTQVWKFQQENRQKLVEAGLSRAEIGEIASRIAQLYFGQYSRSSQAGYLREAFVFYDAILSRDYFNSNSSSDLSLACKHLRFLSRFLAVCLLLNRRQFLHHLLSVLRASLDHYSKTFQDTDFKEWKLVVQELVRFLKSDTSFMNIRPLRYSVVLDPDPDSLESPAALRSLWLRDAVLTSYHHNEVKFSEITLDTFRMLQCLEWESSGSFYQPSVVPKNSQNGSSSSSSTRGTNHSQDIADPSLPPNPRKAVLYRPTVTHFLAVVATICEELPPDGVLFIYLSASSRSQAQGTKESDVPSISQLHVSERSGPLSRQSNEVSSPTDASCLWFGTCGNEGVNCVYPSDLLPFTRRPVFLIVDADNNDAFEAIHGSEKGETAAILLSPSISSRCISADSRDHQSGSIFTAFLTAPIQAFCLLLGISGSTVDTDTYLKAENLLSTSLNEWGSTLVASDIHPVWGQILGDPFLRRLILRFIFCRAVFASYKSSFNKKEFLPRCVPSLPESLMPLSVACRSVVMQITEIFGATSSFMICEGIENTHAELESMP